MECTPSPNPSHVRLRLQTDAGRWFYVGPFGTLGGAHRLAEDLISQQVVRAVKVEHKNRGAWRPAWSFLAGLALLLVVSTGCSAAGLRGAGAILSAPSCGADGGTTDPSTVTCVGRRPGPVTTTCRRTGDLITCETRQ